MRLSSPAMAVLTLCCGVACYVVAFLRSGRNFHVYSTLAILLLLAGLWIALPLTTFETVLPGLAVIGAAAGRHFGSLTVQVHGAICLIPSVVFGGIPGAVAAVICYALALRTGVLFNLALAAASLWLIAELTGFRTPLIAAAALGLAWCGSRWNRLELVRLTYPVMLFGAYRLLMYDLHRESTAMLFLSLLAYGAVLIMVPKVKKAGDW